MKKNKLLYILAALVIVIGVAVVALVVKRDTSEKSKSDTSQSTTTEGTFDCLQPKGDGPHTLECAWGLRAEDGKTYALRVDDSKVMSSIPTGSRIQVTGMITEETSTKYDIVGTIRVEKAEQL